MDTPSSGASEQLPPYSVRCIDLDPVAEADGHHHVTAIETWDPDGGEARWSLVQVIEAVRDGEQFMVTEGDGGQAVELAPSVCPRCSMATLSLEAEGPDVSLKPCS